MVVVGLHQVQHLVVAAAALTEGLAIVARLQLDDPNALAGGAPVLLDDARLEGHRLLEAGCKILHRVVGQRVFQSNVEVGNLAERVLGAHELHHIRRWPHLNAQLPDPTHTIIELALVTTICLDLAWVAAHDDEVELLANIEKLLVLLVCVVNQLAAHARLDHAVREGDGIVAMAIGALVRTTIRLAAHIDLSKCTHKFRLRWLRQQAKIILGNPGNRCHADGGKGRSADDADCFLPHDFAITLSL
mmetsp:Transcript_92209/g.238761  ORF Transcript_92209/g.238761 Transcript_92209/m.238761 type:complete len:246 (-) Transcript_92209:86-823(-)